jgi:hypothetical protein
VTVEELQAIPNVGIKTATEIAQMVTRENGSGNIGPAATKANRFDEQAAPSEVGTDAFGMPIDASTLDRHGRRRALRTGPALPWRNRPGSMGEDADSVAQRPPSAVAQALELRDAKIVELRCRGLTLDEIGGRVGVTRERVRQILKRNGVSGAQALEARRRAAAKAVESCADDIFERYRGGARLTAIAGDLRLTTDQVRELVASRASEEDRARRRQSQAATNPSARLVYTDRVLLDAIRAVAADVGGAPSSGEYARVAGERGLPSLPTIGNRFGAWSTAVRAAGFEPKASSRGRYARRWDDDACWAALRQVAAELGEPPTAAQYEMLSAGSDGLPSLATVRNRLGTWSAITLRLLQHPHENDILRRIGVPSGAMPAERDELIWLAHLGGELSDDELLNLLREGLFAWQPSFGPRPDS